MLALGAVVVLATAAIASADPDGQTGPSSSQSPYLLPSQPGIVTKSILTVGDSVNTKPDGVTPYRMVGIPDGLGAFDNGDGTFTVLMNHELGATAGIARAHGSRGAFVSKWVVRKDDLSVVSGQDLITTLYLWQGGTYVAGTTAFDRFCSADLPAETAFAASSALEVNVTPSSPSLSRTVVSRVPRGPGVASASARRATSRRRRTNAGWSRGTRARWCMVKPALRTSIALSSGQPTMLPPGMNRLAHTISQPSMASATMRSPIQTKSVRDIPRHPSAR